MPLSPVPFITPSGLVTLQHDLKARISSFPLVKVSLTMRPLVKKRASAPFSLALKRHSTTIFSRSSSSSSDTWTSPDCTPASEVVDPMSMTDATSETRLPITPSIGAKIVDRFWPEEEETSSEGSCAPSRYPLALTPPPHHRRAPGSLGTVRDVPVGDYFTPPQVSDGPLRFPF